MVFLWLELKTTSLGFDGALTFLDFFGLIQTLQLNMTSTDSTCSIWKFFCTCSRAPAILREFQNATISSTPLVKKITSNSYCAVSVLHPNVCESHSKGRESVLFVTNLSPYLRGILILFPAVSFYQVISERIKHKTSHPLWRLTRNIESASCNWLRNVTLLWRLTWMQTPLKGYVHLSLFCYLQGKRSA